MTEKLGLADISHIQLVAIVSTRARLRAHYISPFLIWTQAEAKPDILSEKGMAKVPDGNDFPWQLAYFDM
ncbi:hypothetical protein NT2_10_00580 [Caenibius tardaugens NBRC 16725]|uniref:Uncharacterized protein n=1 Tax=Caenibius tardaugens NBRC 16725 TaxID=1219035 RepID=U3A785_9SPHN|nr:hypothetical protein NT2_10_00580 [Caenibius tardaugens NBRC 16725]